MEILNKLFSGGKPKEESSNHEGEYMQEAKAAVEIVNKGVEKGSFSEMTEQLDKLPSVGINRNKYVFEYSKSRVQIWTIALCIILIC